MSNKPSLDGIMKKKNKNKLDDELTNEESTFMLGSDDSKGSENAVKYPWRDDSLAKSFQAKSDEKALPQIGTRTNVRCPEWHYEVATWFAANSNISPNTTHGVLIQAIAIGLEALIEEETSTEWK